MKCYRLTVVQMTRKKVMKSNQRVVDCYFLKLFLIPKHVSLKDEIRRNKSRLHKKIRKMNYKAWFIWGMHIWIGNVIFLSIISLM